MQQAIKIRLSVNENISNGIYNGELTIKSLSFRDEPIKHFDDKAIIESTHNRYTKISQ